MSAKTLEMMKGYGRELHRYLLRRLRKPQDADDIAQDVYERLMRTPDSLIIEKPLAYLYGTASHVLADHMFDVNKRAAIEGGRLRWNEDADDWMESAACVLPDDIADRLNLQQQIEMAMAKLPPTHAAVLLAHKRDGLSYEEVAEKLGLSIFTVEKYLTQAKSQLRTISWEV